MGKQKQLVFDAIKKTREHPDEKIWVNVEDKRICITSMPESLDFYPADWALIKRNGRVILAQLCGKDGLKIINNGHNGHLQWKDVLAHVIEIHERGQKA